MAKLSYNNIMRILIASAASLMLAQFSMRNDNNEPEKPSIDIFGRVVDYNNNTFQAHNITIAGAYKNIIVYMPPHIDKTPEHKIKIDLTEEGLIRIPHKNGSPVISTFNNREYLTIQFTARHETSARTYIIPQGTKIYFDELDQTGNYREHEISLQEVQTIEISGHQEQEKIEDEDNLPKKKNGKKNNSVLSSNKKCYNYVRI